MDPCEPSSRGLRQDCYPIVLVLVHSRANDAANDPVFSSSVLSTLQFGSDALRIDDVRVYNEAFTVAEQCTTVIGGTWSGSSCALP